MAEYQNTVIAHDNFKEALLYYQHVIATSQLNYNLEAFNDYTISHPIPSSWIPNSLLSNQEFMAGLNHVIWSDAESAYTQHVSESDVADIWRNFISQHDLGKYPVFASSEWFPISESQQDVFLSLAKANVIDLANVSIAQVFAFREDQGAQMKLRQFRMFAFEKYQNKSQAYIEDDILQKLSEYHEAAKKHGFTFKLSNLSFWLNSQFFVSAAGGSILSHAFAGLSDVKSALVGSVGAFGIEIGKFALQLSTQKFELANALKENPVSYIVDAKEKLEPKPQNKKAN